MSEVGLLFEHCKTGNQKGIEELLNKKKFLILASVKTDVVDADGNSPLFVATQHGNLEAVRVLLKHGADLDARNQLDMTALMLAAAMKRFDIVKLLLDRNSDPCLAMKSGSTALYLAAENGSKSIVEGLVAGGANVDAPIEDGSTALYIAAQNGHESVVEILIRAGANIDVKLKNGSTPIFAAAHFGHSKVLLVLLDNGADTSIVLENGLTLSDFASSDEIKNILRRKEPEKSRPAQQSEISGDSGTFVDERDGREYRWTKVGQKIWMAENVRFKCGHHCWPSENVEEFGYLYGRPALSEACPMGWRPPEKSDYEELIEFFGGEEEAYTSLVQGGESKFEAKLAGRRYDDGTITNTDTAYFWTLGLDDRGLAWFLKLTGYDEEAALIETWDESLKVNMGASLRCIKD
ncbi:MAG: ankyrin repeat domain-containing protein [Hyphomicrobiaceae bacterium]|nr:ankyrin repeat domain-containing protein [Hyphomicrobiaceae bacterium]